MYLAVKKTIYLILMLSLVHKAAFGAIEVIELEYLGAQEAVELLRPLMKRGESVSGSEGRIVLDVGLQTQKKISKVLLSFDSPPQNLMVSIRRVGSKVEIVESGHLVVRRSQSTSNIHGGVHSTRIATDSKGVFSTRVLNGGEAYLETGKGVVSMKGKQISARFGLGRASALASSAELGSLGVWVSPRLRGDLVTVKVGQESVRRSAQGGDASQRFSSVVKGRLGEWLSLGKRVYRQNTDDRKVVSTGSRKTTENEAYEVKVVRLGR